MTARRTLAEDLAQLEAEDPAVAAAAESLDRTVQGILARAEVPRARFRKSTAARPVEVTW